MLKIRLFPAPLTASAEVPGPLIVRSFSTTNSPLARVMVPETPKTMVSPAAESAMTCRSEPAPLSASDVTVFVAEWARPAKASTSIAVTVETAPAGGTNLRFLRFAFVFIEDSFLSFCAAILRPASIPRLC
jgi:hypothetical protein